MLIFLLLILATGVFFALAWHRSPRYLWAAAGASWIVACFGVMSYGVILLILTFVLVAVALAWELHLRKPWQVIVAVFAAIGLWAVAIRTVDDAWLFFPLRLLEPIFSLLDS